MANFKWVDISLLTMYNIHSLTSQSICSLDQHSAFFIIFYDLFYTLYDMICIITNVYGKSSCIVVNLVYLCVSVVELCRAENISKFYEIGSLASFISTCYTSREILHNRNSDLLSSSIYSSLL